MYYVVRCDTPETENGEAELEIHNDLQIGEVWSWTDGLPFEPEERNFEVPIRVEYDIFDNYAGPPTEWWDLGVPLMSRRIADAVLEAGVDNVEFFPAILRNKQTGEEHDYRAYKVVGRLSATDFGKSEYKSKDARRVGVSFETLALDESKIRGQLMFRLAENLGALIVHEKVRKSILAKGVTEVEFLKPEEWMQL